MIKNVSKDFFKRDYNNNPEVTYNSLAISITNSDDTAEDFFPLSDLWKKSLRITFDDIKEPEDGLELMSDNHAFSILCNVLDSGLNFQNYENIIIHCTAGISRSAAISLFLNQLFYRTIITDLRRFNFDCYNSYVFNKLVEQYDLQASLNNLPSYMEKIRN